jgi:hypothetical protein
MLMRTLAKIAVTVSLILAGAGAGTAMAADDAKPTAPLLSDVLDASGITATGYVDATYSYSNTYANLEEPTNTGSKNTFGLNQVGLTIAKLPATGFGATVSVVAGTEAGTGLYAPSHSYLGAIGTSTTFDVLQAYAQYSSGTVTVMAGKLLTLAGAEVAAPTGNTNITRSYLFWYSEPINHTGVRAAFVASDTATFTLGVNEGWNVTSATGKDKTYEAALTLAPSKTYTLVGAAYYGDYGTIGKRLLLDVVSTWTASDKLTVVGSIDYDTQKDDVAATSYKWWGAAAYVNYAIDDAWRVSVRGEYLDDQDGFATGAAQKLKEGTVTFGFAPSKNFELRLEGRYDAATTVTADKNVTQAWVAAVYKF